MSPQFPAINLCLSKEYTASSFFELDCSVLEYFFKNPAILMNSKQLIEIELFAQEQQKEIFAKALQYWADVSKLSFRSVESPSEADIKIR